MYRVYILLFILRPLVKSDTMDSRLNLQFKLAIFTNIFFCQIDILLFYILVNGSHSMIYTYSISALLEYYFGHNLLKTTYFTFLGILMLTIHWYNRTSHLDTDIFLVRLLKTIWIQSRPNHWKINLHLSKPIHDTFIKIS